MCVAVNDPFVMAAWGEEHKVGDKVSEVRDPSMMLSTVCTVWNLDNHTSSNGLMKI